MATALAGKKLDLLLCSICEERYNEKDRLPKGFPCQHSVCMKCLEGMIALCDGDEVTCPLCRQAVPIPRSNAAGFPNTILILDLLANIQSPVEEAPSTCTQHNKVISVFCSTCQEAICMTCMFKSPKHKGHDMEELSEAIEKCVELSREVLHDINRECSNIQESIEQKAKTSNPQCLKLLQQLQKFQADLAKAGSSGVVTDIPAKTYIPKVNKISPEKPVELASAQVQVDSLLATSLPRSVNTDILQLLASAVLPKFLHIDMNRRNNVLLAFPGGHYAMYRINNKKFCKTAQPTLPEESIKLLEQANHAVLSHDNKVVIPGDTRVMYDNKTYSFHGKLYAEVKVFHEDWFICTYQGVEESKCAVFAIDQNGMAEQIWFRNNYYNEELVAKSQVRFFSLIYLEQCVIETPNLSCFKVCIGKNSTSERHFAFAWDAWGTLDTRHLVVGKTVPSPPVSGLARRHLATL